MTDFYPYQALYDRLRENGYHKEEDHTTHLAPYISWLKERLNYRSVLDIGCSVGGSLPLLEGEGRTATGVDVSTRAVVEAQALGRDVVCASATELPFPDNQFDLVVSADVFEHLAEADAPTAAREAGDRHVNGTRVGVELGPTWVCSCEGVGGKRAHSQGSR